MFCPNCGAQLEDGATFCTHCITEIKPRQNPTPTPAQAGAAPQAPMGQPSAGHEAPTAQGPMWTTTAQFGTGVQGTPAQPGAQAGTAQTGMWAQGPTTTPSTGAPATTPNSGAQAGPGAPAQPSPWPQPGAGAGPKPQGPSRMGPQATTAPPETGTRGATTPKAPSSTGTQPDAKAQTNATPTAQTSADEARPSASTEAQPSPWRPAPKTRSNALTQERKAQSSLRRHRTNQADEWVGGRLPGARGARPRHARRRPRARAGEKQGRM